MAEQVVAGQLQANELKAVISEMFNIDMDVIVHESIDSTNSWSLQQCKKGKVLPFACFAENQTSGKGRRGKQWLMSASSNIAMSVSWPYDLSCQRLHLLSLSIALAVVKTLEELNLEQVQIKWPNDVYVRDKKIAGILIETRPIKQKFPDHNVAGATSSDANQSAVVIGVGLNYDMSSFASLPINDAHQALPDLTDIKREVASQKIEQQPDRDYVAAILLQRIVGMCQSFQQNSMLNLDDFRASYDYCANKTVEIFQDDQEVLFGMALGVNDSAELLVKIDGEMRAFNSAEVSVKAGAR